MHLQDSPPLRLGMLGCGSVATRRMLPAAAALDGVELVAAGSRSAAKAAAVTARFGGRAVVGYEAVLALPEVEAVYISLPAALHAAWIARALAAGKHVLAEKPLTTSHDETARLVGLAKAGGLVLRENYMFPQHRQHGYVRELVAGGAIGQLRAVRATFCIPPRPADDIRYRPELGGGALLDVAGYPLRTALMFLGPDLDVAGASLRVDRARGVDVGGGVLLRRGDGVHAQLDFGMEHHYCSGYELLGGEGRITVGHAFTPPADHRPEVWLYQGTGREALAVAPDDQVANALRAFARQVRTVPAPEPDEAIVVQARMIDQIARQAAR